MTVSKYCKLQWFWDAARRIFRRSTRFVRFCRLSKIQDDFLITSMWLLICVLPRKTRRTPPKRSSARRGPFEVHKHIVREKPMKNEGASDTNPIHLGKFLVGNIKWSPLSRENTVFEQQRKKARGRIGPQGLTPRPPGWEIKRAPYARRAFGKKSDR